MPTTTWTQANRKLAISTPLGDDELLIQSMEMTEQLSRPFTCELKLYSSNTEVEFDDIIGQNVTIRLELADGSTRHINGYVSRFVQGGAGEDDSHGDSGHQYWATVVPWLWFLTRGADCRIFQEMTVPDIIKAIFSDFGCSEMVDDTLTGTYDTLEYVVQYRETAFNFVSRLMEHEGIYYFFTHEDGKHKLVLADAPSAHKEADGYKEVPCYSGAQVNAEGISQWTIEKRLMPGKYAVTDFDFKVPGKALAADHAIKRDHDESDKEIFDYPGDYIEKASGDTRAAIRMDELAINYEVATAVSDARGLYTGCKFTLSGAPREDQDKDYVITSMSIKAQEDLPGDAKKEGKLFESTFTCIPADSQFRPRRVTPKPLINGPQTAIVTGPSGEEVLTDEFGRVKVHFHWDRWNEANEKSSCWIRVAQLWAGKKWGAMFLPRIGQEVVVEFLEGDPDKPLITGRVYNGECQVPYTLPDNKTVSTIKSDSSKGSEGFNELQFEDKKGEERIFVHGEKDLHVRIKNDTEEWVGNDRHLVVVNDQVEEVGNDRSEVVKNDHKEDIKNDRNLNVGGKEAVKITGSKSLTVEGDVLEVFKGDHSNKTTGQTTIKADVIVLEAGTNITLKVGGSTIAIEDGSISIKTGELKSETDQATKLKGGTEVKLESGTSLGLKAGTDFKAEGGTTADLKGSSAATVDGGGSTTIKGGSVSVG